MSSTMRSPRWSGRADGRACGSAPLGPAATMGSNDIRSAPRLRCPYTISAATSCSVSPGRRRPSTSSSTASVTRCAASMRATSCGVFTATRGGSTCSVSTHRTPGSRSPRLRRCARLMASACTPTRIPALSIGTSASSVSRSGPTCSAALLDLAGGLGRVAPIGQERGPLGGEQEPAVGAGEAARPANVREERDEQRLGALRGHGGEQRRVARGVEGSGHRQRVE